MSLQAQASVAIAGFPMHLTCHVATWYWAALEANGPADVMTRAGNIGTMRDGSVIGAQNVMLTVKRSGTWDFAIVNNALPPLGSVLLWDALPTHSAVVTANGITGYNQACVFPAIGGAGYTNGQPAGIWPNLKRCHVIAAETIIAEARRLKL
jgi:hypothetical protein